MRSGRLSIEVPWRDDGFRAREHPWPGGLDYLAFAIPFVIGIGVLLQRGVLLDPGIETLLVAVALTPWALYVSGVPVPFPLFTVVVCAAVFFLLRIAMAHHQIEDISPFLLVALTSHVAALAPLGQSTFTLAVALGAMGLAVGSVHTDSAQGWAHALPWYIGVGAGWCGGFFLQSQLRVMAKLKAAQADLARQAAADERQRIAHELHDVIAHSLTVTMLHVTGARKALHRSTGEAAEALQEAERLGRQSLADVRQVVGVLKSRQVDGETGRTALPEAGDIGRLVEEIAAAGASVELKTKGDVATIAPTTGLALYRIVQESLTNVAKHAPGAPATVALDVSDGVVQLSVTNPLPEKSLGTDSLADGLGLWSMKERVLVVGGSFQAGPRDGHWVVQVSAPTSPAS